jgi:uncharacterized protein (UPF0254 family)
LVCSIRVVDSSFVPAVMKDCIVVVPIQIEHPQPSALGRCAKVYSKFC